MIEIYLLTCKVNGKQYIGQTAAKAYGNGIAINSAKKKYGKNNFDLLILNVVEKRETANLLEIFFIACFDTIAFGYNISPGGRGGDVHTEESKEKLSATLRQGYIDYPDRRKKISEAMRGKPSGRKGKVNSEEHRKKQSEAMLGKKIHSEEHKQWLSKTYAGRTYSPETLRKMSESAKRRANTEEGRAKMRMASLKALEEKV